MTAILDNIANAMNNALGSALTVFLLSMIPLAEAKVAILFGLRMGMNPFEAFGWAFLGSSFVAPILLLIWIPIINALSRTKLFAKVGKFLYDKFEKKSRSLKTADDSGEAPPDGGKKKILTKKDLKRMGGLALFVGVPAPMTGVWTGCAVAAITKVGYVKGLIGIVLGNAVACGLLTLIGYLFGAYVDYIIYAFLAIIVIIVIVFFIKLFTFKPKDEAEAQTATETNDDVQSE
ncbi:MAG: small multi-drug export protein [Clostridiales bacterium]|nr:small multi-drug export protein [Clostridiales bacterium]